MDLKFNVKKQKLERLDSNEIASFTRNYIHVMFDFDEFWQDLQKYVIFTSVDNNKYVMKLGYGKELSCKIPEEVLTGAFFKISVFGGDLLTTSEEIILVNSSGYISDIDDMNLDDAINSSIYDYGFVSRKKHFDEDIDERLNQFEIEEHPYQ